jgi:hypothetical protein
MVVILYCLGSNNKEKKLYMFCSDTIFPQYFLSLIGQINRCKTTDREDWLYFQIWSQKKKKIEHCMLCKSLFQISWFRIVKINRQLQLYQQKRKLKLLFEFWEGWI